MNAIEKEWSDLIIKTQRVMLSKWEEHNLSYIKQRDPSFYLKLCKAGLKVNVVWNK